MTFEQRCIAHYAGIKRRIAWPTKPPIATPAPAGNVPARIKPKPRLYQYDDEGIQCLLDQGYSFARIADHFELPHDAVAKHIRKRNFDLRCHKPCKPTVASQIAIIKEQWTAGEPCHVIALKVGFSESGVQKFVKEQGWQRP